MELEVHPWAFRFWSVVKYMVKTSLSKMAGKTGSINMHSVKSLFFLIACILSCTSCISIHVGKDPKTNYDDPHVLAVILQDMVELRTKYNDSDSAKIAFDAKANSLVHDFIGKLDAFYGPCPGSSVSPLNEIAAKNFLATLINEMVACHKNRYTGRSIILGDLEFNCAINRLPNPLK